MAPKCYGISGKGHWLLQKNLNEIPRKQMTDSPNFLKDVHAKSDDLLTLFLRDIQRKSNKLKGNTAKWNDRFT